MRLRAAAIVAIVGARVVLPVMTFELTVADGGPLQIAAGVTLVGQDGVVLSGGIATGGSTRPGWTWSPIA